MDREYKFHRKTDLDLKPTKTVLTNKNTPELMKYFHLLKPYCKFDCTFAPLKLNANKFDTNFI